MKNKDESIVLTFNGEIYNYQSLREKLIEKGYEFKTHSDTEVLVHLYEDKGRDMLDDLRGMFAFVIYDKNKKQLFGARDFFGIKPFYYTQTEKGTFIYGSEIKKLSPHPDFKKVNPRALERYLTFQYSVLEGIRLVRQLNEEEKHD